MLTHTCAYLTYIYEHIRTIPQTGPALNILIKLMSIVSLVLAPVLRTDNADGSFTPRDPYDQWPAAVGLAIVSLVVGSIYQFWLNR